MKKYHKVLYYFFIAYAVIQLIIFLFERRGFNLISGLLAVAIAFSYRNKYLDLDNKNEK